jgi:CDP-diacylglycerol--glycerol-3-phosphate 3-phosphatidyltransferase
MEDKLNISNTLTVFRLLAGPVIFILILLSDTASAIALFALAVISDILDGYLARKRKTITRFGKILDPISDKLLFGWVIFGILIKNQLIFWIWFASIGGILHIIGYTIFVKKNMQVKEIGRVIIVLETILIILLIAGFVNYWTLAAFATLAFIPAICYISTMLRQSK